VNTYLFQGKWLPVHSRNEIIYVGKRDSVVLQRRSTHHGPVIDELILPSPRKQAHRFVLTMRWTGFDPSDEFRAFYLMNKAANLQEFESAAQWLAVPGQNIVYADTLGNIAHWVGARIPIRRKYNAMVPLPGWLGDADWKGFIPFNQLPKTLNPPEGFIASANNPFVRANYPYYVSELWEPRSRIVRIRELLSSEESFGVDDIKRFQMDILSLHGREFAEYLLRAFESDSVTDPIVSSALEYLRNWDSRFHRDHVAPTIVSATFLKFLHNVFEDEVGDTLFGYLVNFTAIPYRVADQLLVKEKSPWFDDIRTPAVEARDEILRKSLYDALHELQTTMGSDTRLWRWGSVHTVTFVHPFGSQKPLDKVFNIGPFPLGGSGSTVSKAEFRFTDPFTVVAGASMRHVIDLGDRTSVSSVITSGASGQVLHKHYDDQTLLWLNGGYHTILMDWESVGEAGWDRLVVKPE
jgi:penicillin amidase